MLILQAGTDRGALRRFHLDGPLLAGLLLLAAIGLALVYSASGGDLGLTGAHALRLGVAFVVMAAVAQIDPRRLRAWSPWLYLGGLAALVAVAVFGVIGKGAQRWLDLGLFRFQPSELMRLFVPMGVAWYLSARPLPPAPPAVLAAAALAGLPMALIVIQPDLGTALLVGGAGFIALFLAGLGWRWILAAAGLAAAAAPAAWFWLLHDYQRRRVLTFLDPERDPLGAGYHIIQSKIAIGSGGVWGKGWLHGSQAQLDFLPEQSTDFIFAVLAEEFGLLGASALLLLYLFVVLRGLRIAMNARDGYSRILGGSIGLTFFVYVFVNIGMVSGILPVVGVPLPMISYGGTSMVTLAAGFGILMAIHTHRRLYA